MLYNIQHTLCTDQNISEQKPKMWNILHIIIVKRICYPETLCVCLFLDVVVIVWWDEKNGHLNQEIIKKEEESDGSNRTKKTLKTTSR